MSARRTSIGALALYVAISCAYYGWWLLPHPGRMLIGDPNQSDAEIFIWSFAWWPHAVLDWTNPFFSRAIYAPTGINLAQITSVPALAAAFSPVTLLYGPTASFNLASVVLPALAAWTAFLLCRAVSGSFWAGVFGGYLFGFSSFMLAHERWGQLNQTASFVLPLIALVLLRHLRGEIGGRALVWRLGVLVALQAYISTETAVTMGLVLLLGLALAALLVAQARPAIRSAIRPVAAACLLAAVLTAPLLYYSLTGFNRESVFAERMRIDLLNLVVPTEVIGLGGERFHGLDARLAGGPPERSLYLGLALLVILALASRQVRRRRHPVAAAALHPLPHRPRAPTQFLRPLPVIRHLDVE